MYQNFWTANHIMIDLETTGLDDSKDSIVEIGARFFDPRNPGDTGASFESTMLPLLSRRQLNIGYWTETPERAIRLEQFKNAGATADQAFGNFNSFLTAVADNTTSGNTELYMWAKPGHFEWGFLNKYYRELGLTNPIKYNRVVDLRSHIYGWFIPHRMTEVMQAELDAILDSRQFKHQALADVDAQIDMLVQAQVLYKKYVREGWIGY